MKPPWSKVVRKIRLADIAVRDAVEAVEKSGVDPRSRVPALGWAGIWMARVVEQVEQLEEQNEKN
jgi:hypothetical protein